MSVSLWVDDYKPTTLDDYVWQDPVLRQKAEQWLGEKALPNLMFHGSAGTGKTSLAMLLLRLLGIPKGDILFKNASRERKIDDLQDQIINFASTWALNDTGFKYVVLDEADSLSPLAQKFLRGEMEKFSTSCRFIVTCNYPSKIIPALHSRFSSGTFAFHALDKEEYISRVAGVLFTEEVAFEPEDLIAYVEMSYPDLRKGINLVQKQTVITVNADGTTTKVLNPAPAADEQVNGKDYLLEMVSLFKAGRFAEARALITAQAQVEEYPEIYRFFYKNLALWGSTEDQQDEALLSIRRGLVNHAMVADPEINLAATLVELTRITKG